MLSARNTGSQGPVERETELFYSRLVTRDKCFNGQSLGDETRTNSENEKVRKKDKEGERGETYDGDFSGNTVHAIIRKVHVPTSSQANPEFQQSMEQVFANLIDN